MATHSHSQAFTRGRAHRRAATLALSVLAWTTLAPSSRVAAHVFPYIPTQILTPDTCFNQSACSEPDLVYVFSQNPGGDGVQFLSLNISGTVGVGANAKLDTVTKDLPFLGSNGQAAFGAARTETGAVYVYAGECDVAPGTVWTYGDGASSGGGNGDKTWVKKSTSVDQAIRGGASSRGPYFLGGTIAFSATLAPTIDQPTIYSYGGMCATPSDNSTEWQSAANYTKTMMSLAPSGDSKQPDTYVLDLASNAGPRTAIAGFSLTALQPSMSNLSGTVTQQMGYVVLGGHTKQAFINMSTAAVWNLPEESWSYINVQSPAPSQPGKELALRDTDAPQVDSRSGHTAVLSEDGRSVVVLGGWVGDVTNSADPQLAVLKMGQAYSDWRWIIPAQQPQGNGIYGHGAAVLPGNIMMVYGGWEIDSSDSAKMKRQALSTSTVQFLNLTSMTWSSSYSNPNAEKGGKPHDSPVPGTTTDKPKGTGLGLGLGLGIGLGLLAIVLIAFFVWKMKQKKRKAAREDAIRAMAQDASHFIHDTDEMGEVPWGAGGYYSGGQDPWRTGAGSYGGYAPVTPGIARKPVARQLRGGYVPTNAQLTSLISPPGQIHPILEDDEEDLGHQRINPNDVTTPTSEVASDPFLTPTQATASMSGALPVASTSRANATPSPEGPRDPEVQDWVEDVDAADSLLTRYNNRHGGKSSPTRRNSHRSAYIRDDDSRTGSNLSESNRSQAESLNRSQSGPTTEPGKPGSSSSSSYNTAKSGFGALQAEGPSLLLGRTTSSPFDDEDNPREPGSPSKSKPRRSWFGSLRRVFSNSEGNSAASSLRDDVAQQESMDMLTGDYEAPLSGLGGELLRRKQGRHDWEGGEGTQTPDNEWDLERAVEQRLVQVMFTVPKERLRVVNAADDDEGADDENQPLHQPQSAELVDPDKSSTQGSASSRSRMAASAAASASRLSHHHDEEDEGGAPVEDLMDESFLRVDEEEYNRRRLSHSTAGSLRSSRVFTAEAMTLERPERVVTLGVSSLVPSPLNPAKTRVLQMIDKFENKSREPSPMRSSTSSPALRSVKSNKSSKSLRSNATGQ
ncbi:hypothetical protein PT974_09641 [Cladobotryum mycophilum]|uniref:Galactose oxidase n=1 Tax=Cladobotryum mycophilum TaxID=491253 RepID=A0ABR0SGU8_9HYPO